MKFRILCVDDHEANLFTLESVLKQLDNIDIMQALNGVEALEVLLKNRIDLILLDVQMPGMDGFEVADFIQKNKKTKDTPIIFISAIYTTEAFIKLGYEKGAIDYLAKPFDDAQLLNKISFYRNLIDKEHALTKQKRYLQKLLDLQKNMILIVGKNEIHLCNQSLLDFFNKRSLKALSRNNFCISDTFINRKHFLQSEHNMDWIDTVITNLDTQHKVVMLKNNEEYYFNISVVLFDEEKKHYLVTFTDITQLQEESLAWKKASHIDPLTKIFNRNKFEEECTKAIKVAHKYRMPISLMMIDIDNFKKVNDEHGHQAGDEVLRRVAKTIELQLRDGDILGRYGGEEFIVLLPQATKDDAIEVAQRVRNAISSFTTENVGVVTVSIGVASEHSLDNKKKLIKRADVALYKAKENGRNRVEFKD